MRFFVWLLGIFFVGLTMWFYYIDKGMREIENNPLPPPTEEE